MKRLGMVLLGLMFWSMNTLAQEDCGTPPRVLAPGKHSVLLFDQPFVVQWQDDDKCLGDMVKIEIIDLSTKETNIFGDDYPNTGNFAFHLWRGDIGSRGRSRIQISNAYDDSISIESKEFLIKTNGLENTFSEQEMYYDKMEDIAIRDLLIRLTAMERQTGYVEDDNKAWDDSGDADVSGGPGRRARYLAPGTQYDKCIAEFNSVYTFAYGFQPSVEFYEMRGMYRNFCYMQSRIEGIELR